MSGAGPQAESRGYVSSSPLSEPGWPIFGTGLAHGASRSRRAEPGRSSAATGGPPGDSRPRAGAAGRVPQTWPRSSRSARVRDIADAASSLTMSPSSVGCGGYGSAANDHGGPVPRLRAVRESATNPSRAGRARLAGRGSLGQLGRPPALAGRPVPARRGACRRFRRRSGSTIREMSPFVLNEPKLELGSRSRPASACPATGPPRDPAAVTVLNWGPPASPPQSRPAGLPCAISARHHRLRRGTFTLPVASRFSMSGGFSR